MTDTERYVNYIHYLIEKGANPEIVYLPAVDTLILDLIKRGDDRVKADGRSPIVYYEPKEDGTFTIGGRTKGPIENEIYEMEYCNSEEDNSFIKLTTKSRQAVYYTMDFPFNEPYDIETTKTIYIDKEGKIVKEEADTKSIYDESEEAKTR